MMVRRTFGRGVLGLLVGAVSVLTLGGCSGQVSTLRYRLTVEVDTEDGLKTGSSVLEDAFNPGNSYEFSASRRIHGEAPTVDLGGGRYLFVLLSGPTEKRSMQNMISQMFEYPEYPSPAKSIKLVDRFAEANDSRPLIIIKPEDYPGLVTFDNVNDPKSVREVDPGRVRKMTVQVVDEDEPLTQGIEQRLKWLAEGSPDSRLVKKISGSPIQKTEDMPLSRLLSKSDFVWREK